MNIGRKNRLITIQTPTKTYDSEGSQATSWSTGYQVWAEVMQRSGHEIFRHQQVSAEVDTVFRIYFNATVIPDCTQRVVYNSTNYNIVNTKEIEYGEEWDIMAKAVPVT